MRTIDPSLRDASSAGACQGGFNIGSTQARGAVDKLFTYDTPRNGKDVGSPRAFVQRSHSGYYGIVNSEEGYQNLTRLLFREFRVDGTKRLPDRTKRPRLFSVFLDPKSGS